jgi:hypothetical protein
VRNRAAKRPQPVASYDVFPTAQYTPEQQRFMTANAPYAPSAMGAPQGPVYQPLIYQSHEPAPYFQQSALMQQPMQYNAPPAPQAGYYR